MHKCILQNGARINAQKHWPWSAGNYDKGTFCKAIIILMGESGRNRISVGKTLFPLNFLLVESQRHIQAKCILFVIV